MTNIIHALFGKKRQQGTGRDVSALTAGLAEPAIHVVTQDTPSRSHFGGSPELPEGMAWPARSGKMLAFLARISLSDVQLAHPVEWLPATGALLFFYDMDQQPWGFDPDDRGSWAVLVVPESEEPVVPSADAGASPIALKHLGFHRIDSLPSYERNAVVGLNLDEGESDEYTNIADLPFRNRPKHQISGFPAPVQGDCMELECQLASNGLYCGDSSGYHDPRASALEPGAAGWKLLFQFDSDDDLDVMWGDCGTLYFWVEERAARMGDFGNVWLVLQCC